MSGHGIRCDWAGCSESPTRYVQLGASPRGDTAMFVCEAHHRIALQRLLRARGDSKQSIGSLRVDAWGAPR